MKITVLCSDIPYPPNHGGRIDTWNRLVAMKKYGVTLQLVLWYLPSEKISSEQLENLQTVAAEIIQIPRSRSVFDYIRFSYPPRMYSFFPKENMEDTIGRIVSFSPNWVWLDTWHGYLFAKHLKEKYNLHFAYRSQNVEHEYFAFLARSSVGIKKQILAYNARRLKHAETEMREKADIVFDISDEDAFFWGNDINIGKWRVLPTIYQLKDTSVTGIRSIDIGYVGNLWAPNNREGLIWFIKKVLPVIRARLNRGLRIVFAGASPSRSLKEMCDHAGIECIANPESVDEYFRGTSVLINPALNASGINIKMLDMLASGNMIVTTDAAVRGIQNELRKYIRIARTADEFANSCIECLNNTKYPNIEEIVALLQHFYGSAKLIEAIQLMESWSPPMYRVP